MAPDGAITEPLMLCRQPILDRAGAMHGFELLFRSEDADSARYDDVAATSQVLYSAFAELGIERALGPYRGFVNCDERMLLAPGLVDMLPRERVVLEILESVQPTDDVIERLAELRTAGYRLALDDYVPDNHLQDRLLPYVHVVKVDIDAVEPSRLPAIVNALRRFPVQLLAEKVETQDQAECCREAGFDLFQGYFFARPVVIASRKLSLPQLALLRVMSLLLEDADTHAVVDELKHQPGLTVNLLKIANSAAVAPTTRVGSIMQAVVVVGRKQLERWVQLLLYTEPGSRQLSNPLLLLAATRGRLMERLAELLWPGRRDCADQAFLVGMLSLTPAMFGVEMDDILAALPLRTEVIAAVRSRDGPLGTLLAQVSAIDGAPGDAVPAGITPGTFNRLLTESMAWANDLG